MGDKLFQILQINAQKRPLVIHSMMNNESLKDFKAILISEPHVWRNKEGRVILTPTAHYNWTKIKPITQDRKGRWVYRSII